MDIAYVLAKLIKKSRKAAIKNSNIHNTSKIEAGSLIVNSTMEKHSFCGYDCKIVYCDIGSFCSISDQVSIGGGMHPIDWVSTSPVFYEGRDSVKAKFSTHARDDIRKTIIGNDVWIGEKVLIKQGIKIGNGAVVGMGSVVTKDVPPYSIVAGNPAKLIRMRFPEDVIAELERIKWWEFSEKELIRCAEFFIEPTKFIEKVSL